jgi:hypothetical protein
MQAEEKRIQRLGHGGENPSSLEARAGAFLFQARPTVGLSDVEIGAIERRLLHWGGVRRGIGRSAVFAAFAALALLVAGGSVMALVGRWRPQLPSLGRTTAAAPPPRPAKAGSTVQVVEGASDAPMLERAPPSPAIAPAPVPDTRPSVVLRPSPRQEPFDRAPGEGALSAEARFLAGALARWRRDGNAQAALALLGAHERRFPHGALSVESKVARAEILLALARRDQALLVLDSLSLSGLPRARELQTIRGELRAQAGRCREARVDLSQVLLDPAADELGKRASLALTSGCVQRTSDVPVSPDAQGLAALCTSTGGRIETAMCCRSSGDFPDSCLTGACGCSPSNSHSVAICACPNHGCFSTKTGCVPRGHPL